jgi:hypothetical protein
MRGDIDDAEDDQNEADDPEPVLLGPDGRPARIPSQAPCPRCGAGKQDRVSAGFGPASVEYCKRCGFAFR